MSYYHITPEDRQAASEPIGSEIIPAGTYTCVIIKAEDKITKTGSGRGPSMELVVDEGEHKGTKVWDWLLLEHDNPKTQSIARRNWTALCVSLGMPEGPDQLTDIAYKRFQVVLKVEAANGQYPARNRVSYYVLPDSAKAAAKVEPIKQASADWLKGSPDTLDGGPEPF